ncbi:MAG: hypothetical protein ACTHJM_15940 [Marmoricola sp.]
MAQPQWDPRWQQMPYARPKKRHAWGIIIPLWIIASPIAAFVLYLIIRFLVILFFG